MEEIDFNQYITDRVKSETEYLQKTNDRINQINKELNLKVKELEKSLSKVDTVNLIFKELITAFNKIEKGKETDGGWYDSKQKNQYNFIRDIMLNLFNIKEEYGGWKSSRSDGVLYNYLIVNYYNHKELLHSLLKLFGVLYPIEEFKMPYDWSKEDILKFVTTPHYNTNGAIYEVSEYWINSGIGKNNAPYSLLLKSPYILEDDVFSTLLNTIDKKKSNSEYLFELDTYNTPSIEQIQKMGECLIGYKKQFPEKFITRNLKKFNNKTLDYLFSLTTKDNHYKLFHWENFPVEYQKKYLTTLSFEAVLNTLSNYSCKWTIQDKESFLRGYLNETSLPKN